MKNDKKMEKYIYPKRSVIVTLIAISIATHTYKSQPAEVNDNRYAIKNKIVKLSPMTISISALDLKIKKERKNTKNNPCVNT